MPQPVGPFAVPLVGVPLGVPVPPGEYAQVLFDNASPYTCAVNIGGPQRWLSAFTSAVYDIAPGAAITITPAVALAGASSIASLTATFYRSDETVDGSYPAPLAAQAIIAALSVTSLPYLNTIPSSFASLYVTTAGSKTLIPAPPNGMFTRLGNVTVGNNSGASGYSQLQIADGASGTALANVTLGMDTSTTTAPDLFQHPGGEILTGALLVSAVLPSGGGLLFAASYQTFNPAGGG
jgi:hypothetical protein